MFFKYKEIQATLESIESKLNSILSLLRTERLKSVTKRAKEVKRNG